MRLRNRAAVSVEHRLRDGVFGACFDLPFKALDFFFQVHCARIDADADGESGRFANGIVAEVQTVVQLVHHVRQTNRVDVKNCSRVRIRPHLRRIAGNQKQVMQAERGGSQQVRHHSEQIAIAAAVVQHRLDSDFALDQNRSGHRAHARLRARPVRNVDAIDAGVFQQPDRIERLPGIAAFRWQYFDRGDEFTAGDFARPI